jgi:hypothetical protein
MLKSDPAHGERTFATESITITIARLAGVKRPESSSTGHETSSRVPLSGSSTRASVTCEWPLPALPDNLVLPP